MDRAEAAEFLGYLAAAFRQDISNEAIEVHIREISEFSAEAGIRAVKHLVHDNDFFPSIRLMREELAYAEDEIKRENQQALPPGEDESGMSIAEFLTKNPQYRKLLDKIGKPEPKTEAEEPIPTPNEDDFLAFEQEKQRRLAAFREKYGEELDRTEKTETSSGGNIDTDTTQGVEQ